MSVSSPPARVSSYAPRVSHRVGLAGALAVAVSLLGLALRIEHALTFDGPGRGADYAVFSQGMHWMLQHRRPFDFTPEVSVQVGYQPPLFFALGATIIGLTGQERPIAWLAVIGWLIRQLLLARLLREAIPHHKWSMLAALSINALLPISVLTDGKVNPEGLHSTFFMVAVYALWRVERSAYSLQGISGRAAAWFGAFAGLALITKATAALLPLVGAIVFAWQALLLRDQPIGSTKWRQLMRGIAFAGAGWLIVAGWYCVPNILKYHHPSPHIWNLTKHLTEPVLYRRPLGWILPFEWQQYLKWPIIYDTRDPRPNFWATSVVGTWTDIYNRGFCRLKGGELTQHVFGANWGPAYGPEWWVTLRCIDLFSKLAWVGLVVSAISTIAVGHVLWNHLRTAGRRGSLALPVTTVLVVFFVMLFALVYPFDDNVVLNPRYLLPIATPMAACLGISLAEINLARRNKIALHAVSLLAIGAVGVLLVFERFGH
jgi:hypothetical protein